MTTLQTILSIALGIIMLTYIGWKLFPKTSLDQEAERDRMALELLFKLVLVAFTVLYLATWLY